ncbi:MAG: DsrE family protein [Candidatus Aenigmarchaeota archaeon]|nr:DsrE family protein [Candidatus Aenigmarchaeota archaeon]
MKIGIIINTEDSETGWNAIRFANTVVKAGHNATVFLMGKGVEIGETKGGKYDSKSQISSFLLQGGKVLACGTCLKSRGKDSGVCEVSTMTEFMKLVESSDKIVSF